MHRRLKSLVHGNNTCAADDLICCFRSDIIEELLCTLGKLCILPGYENKGTLNHITAVLDRCFTRCNTVNRQRFYGIFDGSKRRITDRIGIACNGRNDIAGRSELLAVFALVFRIGDGLKTVSCSAACFTADEDDFRIIAADLFLVFDFACVDLCDCFHIEIRDRVIRIYDDRNAIDGKNGTVQSFCRFLILEIAA